jgi:integrase
MSSRLFVYPRYPSKVHMPTMLTPVVVSRYAPRERRYEVRDARSSLRLIVFPSGKKSWIVRYRRRGDGRAVKHTIGPVATITLAEARAIAAQIDLDRAQGKEPAKKSPATTVADTYAECAQRYIDEYASVRTRRWRPTARVLGFDPDPMPGSLAERWGDRPVGAITGNDIHSLVVEVSKRGVPGIPRRSEGPTDSMGRQVHSVLSRFFSWLVSQRVIDTNPCIGVHRPQPGSPRERVLTDDEIKLFWTGCDKLATPYGAVFKLLLLLGQRREEISRMRVDELSSDGTVWTLPATRTKNKRTHTITLPPLAREIIASVKRGDRYVFTRNGRPLNGFSNAKNRLDAHMVGVPAWRTHDLRRVAVTGMARAGADLHVIERVINHASGSFGGIVGVYQKHKFADESARALAAWERLLLSIVEPAVANVVSLRG